MGRVGTGNLQPGMVLAGEVKTFKGQLLLPSGTVLTERHIEKLMAWGVPETDIDGHEEPSLQSLQAQMENAPALAAASAALDRRFRLDEAASRAARGPGAKAWAGLRPMSPDGVPVIGRSPIDNLYVNAGHGHLGWTLAAASGSLLADIVLNNPGTIDERDYSWRRFL